ncbi:hypothetical protein HDV05_006656 [Chytridiales sp. JEL 0842]|nr:hypothetical protein HDV05_006656 [Chytridiales sp. JEL 0842]
MHRPPFRSLSTSSTPTSNLTSHLGNLNLHSSPQPHPQPFALAAENTHHSQQQQAPSTPQKKEAFKDLVEPLTPARDRDGLIQFQGVEPLNDRGDQAAIGARGTPVAKDLTPLSMTGITPEGGEEEGVSPATRRRCEMSNVFFLDYYFDLLTYLHQRKQRTQKIKQEIQEQGKPASEYRAFLTRESTYLRQRRTRLRLTHFTLHTQIGQGGYGSVYLATHNPSKDLCALKKMSKKVLVKMGEVEHVFTERDVLSRAGRGSEWLVKLLYAFQDYENVYLAMEFVPGGDFRTLLNNSGCLREEHARFYISEMFIAVSELHRLGYIHRDLKPENFLIDKEGHIKLTDFGLSRGRLSEEVVENLKEKLERAKSSQLTYRSTLERRTLHKSLSRHSHLLRAFSQVGSPDYMAPEVLIHQTNPNPSSEGYGLEIDYWSLGVILFESLAGFPPFTAPTLPDTFLNVLHFATVLERPIYEGADAEFNLSDEAWSLITSLVCEKETRLKGLRSVESHPFFHSWNFSNLKRGNIEAGYAPPFVPQLKSDGDTAYFDDFENEGDMKMYKEVKERQAMLEAKTNEGGMGGGGMGRGPFIGFTFKRQEKFSGATML